MRYALLLALFLLGGAAGLALLPLLPEGAQQRVSEIQQGVKNDGETDDPPTSTPSVAIQRSAGSSVPTDLASTPRPNLMPTVLQITTPGLPSTLPSRTTPTSLPTPKPSPSPTPTLFPSPTPPPTPTLTPVPPPELRHIEYKEYILELINRERTWAGLAPVGLGDNIAAQLHAEASLEGCFSSHWGLDGLKPYMRYTLAGGYQTNAENGSGLDYCIKPHENYLPISSVEIELLEAMDGWMSSPGHRDNILRPGHKKVNIGLAWDRYNFHAVQHFEGEYVEYDQLPALDEGVLTLSGKVINGVTFQKEQDLGVQVYFDPPPHALTRGQVSRTYCSGVGLQVASLRPPLTGNWYYTEDVFTTTYESCPDPYDVSPSVPAPNSPNEAHEFWQRAYDASLRSAARSTTVPWITALEWTATTGSFALSADLWDVLDTHGPGVYTVTVWGNLAGEGVVISKYSIFHEVVPPDTYDPANFESQ